MANTGLIIFNYHKTTIYVHLFSFIKMVIFTDVWSTNKHHLQLSSTIPKQTNKNTYGAWLVDIQRWIEAFSLQNVVYCICGKPDNCFRVIIIDKHNYRLKLVRVQTYSFFWIRANEQTNNFRAHQTKQREIINYIVNKQHVISTSFDAYSAPQTIRSNKELAILLGLV